MIEIKEVKTHKQKREFATFPIKLYKNEPNYIPPLIMDELALMGKKNASFDVVDMKWLLAYKDGKVVGRVCGVIQHQYNEKINEKRIRFVRFDCIDDQEVANALLGSIEKWGKEMGMTVMHGPLGFNDLDREGLLIEGFENEATFEINYNFAYYQKLIENYGFEKDADWLSFKIYPSDKSMDKLNKINDIVLKRYKLKVCNTKNKLKFIKHYKDGLFDCIDAAYGPLYGVVPYTPKVRKQLLNQFKYFLNMKYFICIVDESDKVVAFGFGIPSLAKASVKHRGKLTGVFDMLHSLKHPEVLDLALVGILPEYQGKGLNAVIMKFMQDTIKRDKVKYCDTNICLENNTKILQQWDMFEKDQHRRLRVFKKNID